jgi:hypothetical protein
MLGRSLVTGISLHGGPLSIRGEPGICGGESYTGDFVRFMKVSSGEASLREGFHVGRLGGEFLYWKPERLVF